MFLLGKENKTVPVRCVMAGERAPEAESAPLGGEGAPEDDAPIDRVPLPVAPLQPVTNRIRMAAKACPGPGRRRKGLVRPERCMVE
jgi:hypothetical protein